MVLKKSVNDPTWWSLFHSFHTMLFRTQVLNIETVRLCSRHSVYETCFYCLLRNQTIFPSLPYTDVAIWPRCGQRSHRSGLFDQVQHCVKTGNIHIVLCVSKKYTFVLNHWNSEVFVIIFTHFTINNYYPKLHPPKDLTVIDVLPLKNWTVWHLFSYQGMGNQKIEPRDCWVIPKFASAVVTGNRQVFVYNETTVLEKVIGKMKNKKVYWLLLAVFTKMLLERYGPKVKRIGGCPEIKSHIRL